MSYEFLRDYTTPVVPNSTASTSNYAKQQVSQNSYYGQMPPEPPTALLCYGDDQETYSGYSDAHASYIREENTNRRQLESDTIGVHPGHSNNLGMPYPLKRKYNKGPALGTSQPNNVSPEEIAEGEPIIFHGRDESYPVELNALIHPKSCDLCKTNMNSLNSAKDHFQSKTHDRNITAWLKMNYTEKGLEPPTVKRFKKDGGPVGAEAFHCELCDLKLTSLLHANQHYAGRKHRLVANKISKPSGAGYFNTDGKWVRTGTKLNPKTDSRFGIGEQFVNDPSNNHIADTIITIKSSEQAVVVTPADLHCSVCNINVTSAPQMKTHLEGIKHRKKLILCGGSAEPVETEKAITTTDSQINEKSILASLDEKASESNEDLSMFRTPSGSYYCKTCNLTMMHGAALSQHLIGKKHMRNSVQNKAIKTKADSVE